MSVLRFFFLLHLFLFFDFSRELLLSEDRDKKKEKEIISSYLFVFFVEFRCWLLMKIRRRRRNWNEIVSLGNRAHFIHIRSSSFRWNETQSLFCAFSFAENVIHILARLAFLFIWKLYKKNVELYPRSRGRKNRTNTKRKLQYLLKSNWLYIYACWLCILRSQIHKIVSIHPCRHSLTFHFFDEHSINWSILSLIMEEQYTDDTHFMPRFTTSPPSNFALVILILKIYIKLFTAKVFSIKCFIDALWLLCGIEMTVQTIPRRNYWGMLRRRETKRHSNEENMLPTKSEWEKAREREMEREVKKHQKLQSFCSAVQVRQCFKLHFLFRLSISTVGHIWKAVLFTVHLKDYLKVWN